jgi:TonB-dependent starch-binding outer membrane protein SusC
MLTIYHFFNNKQILIMMNFTKNLLLKAGHVLFAKANLAILAFMLFGFAVQAQNRTVTGKVVDEQGTPLIGANITAVGSKIVQTKGDGTFSITLPINTKSLSVSYTGYVSKTITLSTSESYEINLTPGENRGEEVVVVAYGTARKPTITGSVARVGSSDIEGRPFTSVDKILQGQVAGLQSVAASGTPGAAQAIRIRGIGSISASAEPLWVLDGVPINSGDASRLTTTSNLLSTLNPNDIESVTVLKDAASASIYGSRAANGVILVTTKKGKSGKTKFSFDTEMGQSDIAYFNEKYRALNAKQFFDLTREGLINAGLATSANVDATMTSNFGFGNGQDFNWLNGVTQNGKQQQYNLSASGGTDKTRFFLSGGYFTQEGLTTQSDYKRYSVNTSLSNQVNERLQFGINANVGHVEQDAPLSGGSFGNPVLSSFFLLPSRNAYKPDGSLNYGAPDFGTGALHNTILTNEWDKRHLSQTSIRSSVNAEYKIMKDLKFRSQYGIDYNVLEEDQYNNPFHGDGLAASGRAFAYYTRYFNHTITNTLDYKKEFLKNGDLMFDIKVGQEAQNSKGSFINVQSQGFPLTTALILPAVGATPIQSSKTLTEYSFESYFSLANINYKDKYVISGGYRKDGSSRFGAKNKFGNFWSIGGTWNVDKENFMQNVGWVSQLKLRASYGVNGNAGIGNYDALATYAFGVNYNQQPGSAPSNPGNDQLTWELNKPTNVGIDLGFVKNRVTATVDYYIRKSSNLLLNNPVSLTTGFGSILENIGAMENKGIELTINAKPVIYKDFTWDVSFNITQNKNKITSLPGGNDIVAGSFVRRVGYDFQTFYVRRFAGVDPANGDPLWYVDDTKSATTNNWNAAQRTVGEGSASPKVFGGFTNIVSFKGISIEAQFNFQYGNRVQDTWGGFYNGSGNGGAFNKVYRQFEERWTTPGQNAKMPRYVYNGNKLAQNFSTFYLADGDFVRLRNLQIGYQIPKSLSSKLRLNGANFYVRGANLFTWVKDEYLPFDPEQGVASQTNLNVFIPKTITVGLNISF